MKKLNIGCGKYIKKGWVNLDTTFFKGVDVFHDLEKFPYPFGDNYFSEVYAHHIIEHLNDIPRVLEELHRICINGAFIEIHVPHFACNTAHNHLYHKKTFGCRSFNVIVNQDENYTGKEFILESVRLRWTHQKTGMMAFLGRIIDYLSNKNQLLYERFWCYWVGGSYEIIFRLKVVK